MKVFAFDYLSAGGLSDRPVPDTLRQQGALMLRALLADLALLPGIELITTHDQRQPLTDGPPSARMLGGPGSFMQRFAAGVQAADAVWPLAPESGGTLEYLSRKVQGQRRLLLGCRPDAVHTASSKLLTARALLRAGIPVVATYSPLQALPPNVAAWVVKPEHGAGCINTRIFNQAGPALDWVAAEQAGPYVLQPFIAGKLCSLCLLCRDGQARVLSCNLQRIAVRDNQFYFLGSTVNGIADHDGQLGRCARQVAAALPGLWGYVGIDLILGEQGLQVLEINPRMTTSCAGLHESLGTNPAAMVFGMLEGAGGAPTPTPAIRPVAVSVDVEAFGMT